MSCFLTKCVHVCACFCGCRYKVHTQSEGEDVECPLFQDLFLWLLSSPCLLSGRGFSNLYARFVYFCLPGYSGWCVSFTHTPHIPPLFLVIARLFALDLVLSFSQVSVVRYFSLSSLPFSSPLLSGIFSLFHTILNQPTNI